MRPAARTMVGLLLTAALGMSCAPGDATNVSPAPEQRASALGTFAVTVASTDATSVKLKWSPQSGAAEYVVHRDGVPIGSTVGKTGDFTDFGLQIARTYQYSVTALDASGAALASSTTASATTTTSAAARTRYKVLAIGFVPNGESLATETTFLKHRIEFLKLASLGSANIELYSGRIVASAATPAVEPGGTMADYGHLVTRRDLPGLGGYSMVDLVEKGDVDHVWVVRSPVDFWENVLVGNRPIQGNGQWTDNTWPPLGVKCSRSFFVNFYLPDERAYDAYAHCIEGVMTSVTDGHPETYPRQWQYQVYTTDRLSWDMRTASLNVWERFRMADQWNGGSPVAYASPGNASCGSSHFPPTTPRSSEDYTYWDPDTWRRYVDCSADDWLMYPGASNVKRKLNGYDYGALNNYALNDASYAAELTSSPEQHPSFSFSAASFHQWWFAHLPHNPGTSDGKLNNWWPYIYDFNRFDGSYINYTVSGLPEIPTSFRPIGLEYGTDESGAASWGYWHSQNGFSPGAKSGQIAVVSKSQSPSSVRTGSYAIKATIENAQYWDQGGFGRNDVFFPASRNAHLRLPGLKTVKVSVKLGTNPGLIAGTNPVIRLCKNGGNRIELVPTAAGAYTNLFADTANRDAAGWYTFTIPVAGSAAWEKNVIGYVDPSLSAEGKRIAREQIEQSVLSDLNYVEISIRSTTSQSDAPSDVVSYLIDDLELLTQ